MSLVDLQVATRGGQALVQSPIEVNSTTEDGGGMLFHDYISLMCQIHYSSRNQRQCAYYWSC